MPVKKYDVQGRWFLDNHLWQLENASEIRAAARAARVRLVDASLRQPDEEEAAGKPKEILSKVGALGSLDSSLAPQQTQADIDAAKKLQEEVEQREAGEKLAAEKRQAEEAAEKQAAEAAEKARKAKIAEDAKVKAAQKAADAAAAKEAAAKAAE